MPHRVAWGKFRDFVKFRILHVDDSPHQIALGAAIAVFVAWTPTIGLQMIIVLALAAILRANKAITIPAIWITNPITVLPILWCNFKVGAFLLGPSGDIDLRPPTALAESQGILAIFLSGLDPVFWLTLSRELLNMGQELWLGSLVVGLFAGTIAYSLVHVGVTQYRLRYRPDLLPRMRAAGRRIAEAARHHSLKRKTLERGKPARPRPGVGS